MKKGEQKHTEGPWSADGITSRPGRGLTPVGQSVHDADGINVAKDIRNQANARLIASAPDLLTLAKFVRNSITEDGKLLFEDTKGLRDHVVALIAKAEGR